jgi:hypothetical protein
MELNDKLFKILIIIIGIAILTVCYMGSLNGRYNLQLSPPYQVTIVDTRTGILFDRDRLTQKWTIIDPIGETKPGWRFEGQDQPPAKQ